MPKSSESFVPTKGSRLGPQPENLTQLSRFASWLWNSPYRPKSLDQVYDRKYLEVIWYVERLQIAIEHTTEYRALWVKWRMLGEPE